MSARRGVLAGALLLALGGASAAADGGGGDEAAPRAAPSVHLTLRYDPGPGAARTATVRCGREQVATGWLRTTASRACRVARTRAQLLTDAPPDDQVCAQVYGGPQTARVRGRVGGVAVDRRFTRADGCDIAAWTALRGLLPPAPASGAIPVPSP